MCVPETPTINTQAIVEAQREQLNKNNVTLSNEKTASTTGEKTNTKRTVSSLRVPLQNTTNTSSTGLNTTNTATGLNIPV